MNPESDQITFSVFMLNGIGVIVLLHSIKIYEIKKNSRDFLQGTRCWTWERRAHQTNPVPKTHYLLRYTGP